MSDVDQWTDAGVQALQQSTAEQVRNSVSQALPVNPDTEAQLRRDANAARIPLPAARALPDVTRVQAQMSQVDADLIARKFPSTAQLLANPDLAKITHDDIPKTTQVEQHATALAGQGFMGPPEPTLLERAKTPDFWTGVAKYLFSANEGKDNLTSDVGSAATALSGKIGQGAALTAAGALTVVGAGGTAAQDKVFGVAKAYGDQAAGEDANPAAFHNKLVKSAATLGLQLPMMMAGGGTGPMLEAGETGVATLTKYLGDAVIHGTKAMSTPALTDAIDMMHRVYEKTGDLAAAARAGQAQYAVSTAGGIVPLNAPGGIAARMLAGGAAGTVQGELSRQGMNAALPDSMQSPFNAEDAAVSGVVGSLTAGVMGPRPETGRNAAVRAFNDAYETALAEHRNDQIIALAKAAASSKLRERDPQAFHQFVQDTVNQGDAPKGLYIDAHQLASILQAHEITAGELHQTMPDVAAQLDHAIGDMAPDNGLVQIPIADFATHIAGSALEEPLLQHLRVNPEGGTIAESKAYHESQTVELAAQAERLTAANAGDIAYQDSLNRVHNDLHTRLQAIGMRPDIAAANAAPLAAFYQVHADRLGILPHEVAEQYPVHFTNRAIAGDTALNQGDVLDLGELHHVENNASGESSASLEAQNRLASEKAAGQSRYVIDSRTGDVRPLVGVDAVDTQAAKGQIIVQRNVGASTWSVLSTGGDVTRNAVTAAVARAQATGVLHQPVFHGSPHTFEKFSLDHIGTGEGAQAYGWGLYFAENRNVAAGYFKALADNPGMTGMKLGSMILNERNGFDYSRRASDNDVENVRASLAEDLMIGDNELHAVGKAGFRDHVLKMLDDRIANYYDPAIDQKMIDASKTLRKMLEKPGALSIDFHPVQGGVYSAHIPDEAVGRMLLWDKPLSEQPTAVQEALAKLLPNEDVNPDGLDMGGGGKILDNRNGQADPTQVQPWVLSSGGKMFGLTQKDVDRMVADHGAATTGENAYTRLTAHLGGQEAASKALAAAGIPGIRYLDQGSRDTADGTHNVVLFDQKVIDELNSQVQKALYQDARGTFSPTTKTITQLKNADLSTFQHELGHFFLDTLSHMAAQADAPSSVKTDMQTLLNWGGVPDLESWQRMTLDEQRALHEKFATGWETYLMKGEAPSMEMRSLFSRFRAWMLNVYKSLKGAPGDYTPEVKGVFDRMIASEDAIAQAEQARRYMPLFDSPEKSAMTPEEWTAYQALGKDATEKAVEALTGKTLKDMAWMDRLRTASLKAVTKDAAEKRAAIVNEVKAEVMGEPVYRAWSFLTGKVEKREGAEAKTADATTGAGKLNTDALKAAFGEEVAAKLYEMKMTGKKGIEPSVVADMFGFPDAQSLVKALTESEPPKSVVEGMADQRMLERHGEIADPQALQRTADELVHNEVRARFVATEFKALKKATGSATDIANAAKEAAGNAIDTRRIRDISASQYDAAETRSAKAAERAMAKGDTAGAAAAKRDQILSMQLARAARDAQEFVEKAVNYLKKFDTPSTREAIDLEYRDQIDALLDRADLRKSVTNKSLDRREALQAFVERLSGEGLKPQVPESLLDEAQRWHYKDMPFAAFKGLVDAVKSLEHLGKMKSKLLDGKETREIAALADEMRDTAAQLPQRAPESNRGLSRIDKAWLGTKAFGRSAQAAMLKMEQVFDWLDARNSNGVLNRVVFRRISDAGVHEADMLKAVKSQIGDLVTNHLADVTKDRGKIYVAEGLIDGATGLPQRFTTKEMLMLAGNMGNESNAAKMAKGEKWDQAEVWNFLHANMTKAHWDFVAGMGRTLESLWPEKLAMDRRLGNTSPEKIEPRPFDTPHGRYEGWYWPLMYDPARSQDVAERGARQGDAMFENIYAKANTDTGRMNTRNENYARPLLLDLDALPRMIKDEIHDIAYREAIIDADRFLSHPTVRKAIIAALSQEHYDQIRPWLQSIANDGKTTTDGSRGMEFFNTIAREARTRATMVGLGLRLTTALVHGSTAASESVSELGAKWMASGLKDFANPTAWAANKDFVFERSGEMRNRMNEVDRDVRENLREIDLHMMDPTTGAVARGADVMRAHAYSLIAGLDMASALPTWMGAYKKAMTGIEDGGLGLSEKDAVYFADKTVRNAHGGTGIKDMARVQRGTEFQKLFTMFYTFWNHNINRIIDTSKLVTSSEHRAMLKDQNNWSTTQLASTVILRTLAYTFGVQAIHSLINPPKKDDDSEHWALWAAKELAASAFAGIPIARDISAHYLTGRDYSVTPAASMVDALGKSGQDAANALTGKAASDKWLKHTIATAGYVFNLPLGQPASTAQFLWDLGSGKAQPSSAKEWWAGLAHGDIHAHH